MTCHVAASSGGVVDSGHTEREAGPGDALEAHITYVTWTSTHNK